MIEAVELTRDLGATRVLDAVGFRIETGRIAGLVGPNGAGKTTVLRILAGILPPSGGSARIAGLDVVSRGLEARRRLGFVAEGAPLHPDATVAETLTLFARLKGLDRASMRRAIAEVVESCDLGAITIRLVGQLSRGTRQRVALAAALLGSPEVLLLDEPTVGLDPDQVRSLRERIGSFRGERTVLFSSHALGEVRSLADDVVVLASGRVLATETPASLERRLLGPLRARIRVEAPATRVAESIARVTGVSAVVVEEAPDEPSGVRTVRFDVEREAVLREVGELVRAEGWLLVELRHEAPSLEDAFLELVAGARS